MLRNIGVILLVVVLAIVLVSPLRNYLSDFAHRNKRELSEKGIIGDVSGYNPRVKEVQDILKAAGFEPGLVDGVIGAQTRVAIRKFQNKKGLATTGKLDYNTWTALMREKENPKSTSQEQAESKLAQSRSASAFVKLGEETSKVETKDIKQIAGPQGKVVGVLQSKDKTTQIQLALQKAGFYKGKLDGKMGIQTKMAIRRFQKSKGLKVDGVVGKRTWEELSKYLKD
jgi:peptidoglycan hydrolase-like protein with peptidoglycan-binding domain